MTREKYQHFIDEYGSSHSKSTVFKINSLIHACVKDAIYDEHLKKDFIQRTTLVYDKSKTWKVEYLNIDEMIKLVDYLINTRNIRYSSKYMILVAIYTGMRLGEIQGLMWKDIDFKNNGIKIRRKGGYEAVIYFGEEVETALLDYLEQRNHIIPAEGNENALFLSLQNKRISVRAVEKLVKKYASLVTNLKKITPHKLRSTYGTSLYRETGDIYLVADVLGHKDVNTTRKHYAAIEDDRRRMAANVVRLRENKNED